MINSPDWIELFPFGFIVPPGQTRPLLILKDEAKQEVLPVWMSSSDMGSALSDRMTSYSGPHGVARKILKTLKVELTGCYFVELQGHHQFVELHFSGNSELSSLKFRADEAMSFCLQADARFFSNKDIMQRCRQVQLELDQLEQGILRKPEIVSKSHRYMM